MSLFGVFMLHLTPFNSKGIKQHKFIERGIYIALINLPFSRFARHAFTGALISLLFF